MTLAGYDTCMRSTTRLIHILKLPYHYSLALLGAVIFGFPSRQLTVIAVTGTKGKSSVVELVGAILEEAGFKTASASTIHFKIGDKLERNLHKMTMPGRFFLQRFLRQAVRAGCTHAVIEMTSEGARQFRHKFVSLNALIFTNLSPEHIESHGSYEKYRDAKLSLARALQKSPKKNKILVVNGDDKEAEKFLNAFGGSKAVFSKQDAKNPVVTSEGVSFTWTSNVQVNSKLPGEFNLCNILAAVTYAKAAGIPMQKIKSGIEKVKSIRGRAERISLEVESSKFQGSQPDFSVIVDYAHTADSLQKLYATYAGKYRICVLGNTGGGRDKWKRPVMGEIAEKYCDEIILTNEDPYDEDPEQILREMSVGIKHKIPHIILDRRAAIREALQKANESSPHFSPNAANPNHQHDCVVLITGKGTDPYIMGPHGSREPWDDATVVREELAKILASQNP
ncbi:MAG: UDP-N-acetylmuramyl-tripeptide synthetase [bacterium]|nr:UDP-N-acetylmuramyl-tripeptide synthetase [bacterium]